MPSVRQQINVAGSPRTVWERLTTAEGLSSWWADEARVDPTKGGRLTITSEGDDGEPLEGRGTFLEARPTRKLEIKFDPGSPGPSAGSRLTFQLARDGDETRVILIHAGAFLDDEELFQRYTKEWRGALQALRSAIESD